GRAALVEPPLAQQHALAPVGEPRADARPLLEADFGGRSHPPTGYHGRVRGRRRASGRRSGLAALALAALAGCAHASPRAQDGAMRWRYRVAVPAALDVLDVELCFHGGAPRRLVAGEPE